MYEVLLVDDEPFAIEGLKLLIDWEKYGFRIRATCENGEDAIRRIRSDPPDLVVTDIRMPGMDGLQLIEEARSAGNRSTLFVIASGYGDFDYALRAMHLGVSHYLTKPLMENEAEEMLERLGQELQEREMKQAIVRQAETRGEQRALEAVLFGKETVSEVQAAVLERLSRKAASWRWICFVTEPELMPSVREALRRAEPAPCFSAMIESEECGLVIGSADKDEAGFCVRDFAERIRLLLPPEAYERVRLAIGRSVGTPEELRLSQTSAEAVRDFSFFENSGVVAYEETQGIQLSDEAPPVLLADRIAESTEKGSEEEVLSALASAFAGFKKLRLHPRLVQAFSERVVLGCASVLKELGGNPEPLIRSSPFCGNEPPPLTLEQTALQLERFCLGCRKEALLLRECSGGGVQGQVAHFLRSHYTDTFTIQELAERFYVHPAYLGQSFARKYGVGISEFVHGLRIDEACRLLRESNLASCAIAEQIGYKDYRHFLKQFEKKTGTKPAAYRAPASG